MIAQKQSVPLAVACILAASSAALAGNLGSPGSALDPNNYVAPPASRAQKAPRAEAPAGEVQEEVQSTTTFVTMPGFENQGEKTSEKPAKVKQQHQSNDDGNGLLSGVNDKFKSAGSGLASSTKEVGDQMKKGTKAVGGGIASGAKASGSFFMKGARAIGEGTKKMGSKVAQGAKAAGDTVKDGTHAVADKLPFTGKSGKVEQPKAVASKQEDLKPAGGTEVKGLFDEKSVPAPAPVASEAHGVKTETKVSGPTAAKPGLMGKTLGSFGKLNVFHKKEAGTKTVETAGKAPAGSDVIR